MSYDAFRVGDLLALEALYGKAEFVVPTAEAARYENYDIVLRHDVDNEHALAVAVQMAHWEYDLGVRSTYFLLHTAPYWQDKAAMQSAVDTFAMLGHEVGFHVNALAESIRTGRDAAEIAEEALEELRSYGAPVTGVVAHGDALCYGPGRELRMVNDELFLETPRPELGEPDRIVYGTALKLKPISRAALGLEYDPNFLPRAEYLSDSGGRWNKPFPGVAYDFPYADGPLHMLVHPDWWRAAFQ